MRAAVYAPAGQWRRKAAGLEQHAAQDAHQPPPPPPPPPSSFGEATRAPSHATTKAGIRARAQELPPNGKWGGGLRRRGGVGGSTHSRKIEGASHASRGGRGRGHYYGGMDPELLPTQEGEVEGTDLRSDLQVVWTRGPGGGI